MFATAVDLFVDGEVPTTSAFNRACGLDTGGRTAVSAYFDNLVRLDILQLQATGHGNGKSPYIFNWSRKDPETVTLRDAVEPFINDAAVPGWQKRRARTALRFLLDLGRKCVDPELFVASERVPAKDIIGIPERGYRLAIEAGLDLQTAKNYRSDLRRLLRHGCENAHIPMVFPLFWEDDPWTEAMLRWFPRKEDLCGAEHPMSDAVRSQLRSACRRYRQALVAVVPGEADKFADPAEATAEVVKLAADYWMGQGEIAHRNGILKLFSQLAAVFGVGPNKVKGATSRADMYLSGAEGEFVTGMDGFANVVRHHALPEEWIETFAWLEIYETTPSASQLRKLGFPARRSGRIKRKSFAKRLTATRALLGTAVNIMGLAPESLSVREVFGERYGEIIDSLTEAWAETGEREVSGGLRDIIVQSGMICYALFRKAGHEAGQSFTSGETKKRQVRRRILLHEVASTHSEEQRAYLASYELSQERSAEVIEEMDKRSPSAANTNSVKDIREVVRDTPPRFWIAILDGFHDEIQRAMRLGRDDGYEFHCTALAAVIHGIILATGFRQSEPTHVRIGDGQFDHYDREGQAEEPDRIIRLFRWDRKNGRALNGLLRERYLPRWLEDIYVERTVTFFKARGLAGDEKGVRLVERPEGTLETPAPEGGIDPETGLPFADHRFFLVNTYGVPFGCPEESECGVGRDERAHAHRVNSMAKFWKRNAARMAARLGLTVPVGDYGFTLHDMRNVMGYWIRSRYGTPVAASYLGDRESTVEKYYSALDGQDVDLSGVDDLGEQAPAAEGAAGAFSPSPSLWTEAVPGDAREIDAFEKELTVLDRLRTSLLWDEETFREHVQAAMAKHGLGAAR